MTNGKILKAAEVAKILRITTAQVYKLARAGEIPSIRIGGSVRFSSTALASWMESQTNVLPEKRD